MYVVYGNYGRWVWYMGILGDYAVYGNDGSVDG